MIDIRAPYHQEASSAPAALTDRCALRVVAAALLTSMWIATAVAVATRRPVVDAELAAGGGAEAGWEDLAAVSGLIFLGLGIGAQLLALLWIARTLDFVLARAWSSRQLRMNRLTVTTCLLVVVVSDLVRGEPAEPLGSAVPALLGVVVSGIMTLLAAPVTPRRRTVAGGLAAVLGTVSCAMMGAPWLTTG